MSRTSREQPRKPSVLRSYAPPVLFLLLCGIVGPIFLVVGIAVRDVPETGWLIPSGAAITILDIVIGLLVGRSRHRGEQKAYRLGRLGRRATAQVLSFEETGVLVNDQPYVKLRLHIHGTDITPFEVEDKQVISYGRMGALHDGELPVTVDPETREWLIDWDEVGAVRRSAVGGRATTRPRAERLAELDDLLRRDLISRDEYDERRSAILDEV